MTAERLRPVVLLLGWLTSLSGLVQLVVPGVVLGLLDADASPAPSHFFAIVGMFMVLFGGMLAQATRIADGSARVPLFWCGMQKLGASVAVGIGVARDVFAPLALGVAGLDLLSAILILLYRRMLRV